jgi:hypothetical protein
MKITALKTSLSFTAKRGESPVTKYPVWDLNGNGFVVEENGEKVFYSDYHDIFGVEGWINDFRFSAQWHETEEWSTGFLSTIKGIESSF